MGCENIIPFNPQRTYISETKNVSKEYFPLVYKSISLTMDSQQKEMKNSFLNVYSKKQYVQKEHEHNYRYKPNKKQQKTIHWKKYILSILSKKKTKSPKWAEELFQRIKTENFIFEKIFTSEATFHEYSMNFEPRCLKIPSNHYSHQNDEIIESPFVTDQENKDYVETNIIVEENYEEIMQATPDIIENKIAVDNDSNKIKNNNIQTDNEIKYHPEYVTEKKINKKSNHLIMNDPIVDKRSASLFSVDSNEEDNELKEAYLHIIHIIREHMINEEHPIVIVIRMFREEILKEMRETPIHEFDNEEIRVNKLNNVIKDIQSFLMHLQIALKLFYFKSFNFVCFKEEKDEILNLITTLLFSNKEFYKFIFDLYKKAYFKTINELRMKLSTLGTISLQESGTDEKFCLDDKSIKAMITFVEKNEINLDKRSQIKSKLQKKMKFRGRSISTSKQTVEESSPVINLNEKDNDPLLFNNSDDENENESDTGELKYKKQNQIFNDLNFDDIEIEEEYPYQKSAQMLRELSSIHSPYQKMIQLVKIGKEIRAEVHSFWSDIPKYLIKKESLGINTDNFLSIFNYLIAKNNEPYLYIHYKMIDDFTGEYSKNSNVGYYQVILECSLRFIKTIDKKEKMRDREKKRTMITKKAILFRSILI